MSVFWLFWIGIREKVTMSMLQGSPVHIDITMGQRIIRLRHRNPRAFLLWNRRACKYTVNDHCVGHGSSKGRNSRICDRSEI
jgi:hypothetical protein